MGEQRGFITSIYDSYSLPMRWSYAESYPISNSSGSIQRNTNSVVEVVGNLIGSLAFSNPPVVLRKSALERRSKKAHLIITDPPYYDQIPYSDTLDFFYLMIKEICSDLNSSFAEIFSEKLTPKWSEDSLDRELIDDANRHGKDKAKSKEPTRVECLKFSIASMKDYMMTGDLWLSSHTRILKHGKLSFRH